MVEVIGYKDLSKDRNLKKDFIEIQNDLLFKQMTRVELENAQRRLRDLFDYFGLENLEFILRKDLPKQRVIIKPIGKLAEYAILGILNLDI